LRLRPLLYFVYRRLPFHDSQVHRRVEFVQVLPAAALLLRRSRVRSLQFELEFLPGYRGDARLFVRLGIRRRRRPLRASPFPSLLVLLAVLSLFRFLPLVVFPAARLFRTLPFFSFSSSPSSAWKRSSSSSSSSRTRWSRKPRPGPRLSSGWPPSPAPARCARQEHWRLGLCPRARRPGGRLRSRSSGSSHRQPPRASTHARAPWRSPRSRAPDPSPTPLWRPWWRE
jgi:hypothetical protein